MKRIKCTVTYDGTNFNGFQIQPKGRTVQGELEKALKKLHKGERIQVQGSGRTDTGVHAHRQVIHFDTPLNLPDEKWPIAFITVLPKDIIVKDAKAVESNFHARYDVIKKEYHYHIYRESFPDVFRRNYSYHFSYPLQLHDIRLAMQHLKGTHDFTSFSSSKTKVTSRVRTIYVAELVEVENEIIFKFVGDGFLHNMVRIMVGTLLDVGQGRKAANDIPAILELKNREKAGKTVPGHGLYLWNVYYGE